MRPVKPVSVTPLTSTRTLWLAGAGIKPHFKKIVGERAGHCVQWGVQSDRRQFAAQETLPENKIPGCNQFSQAVHCAPPPTGALPGIAEPSAKPGFRDGQKKETSAGT